MASESAAYNQQHLADQRNQVLVAQLTRLEAQVTSLRNEVKGAFWYSTTANLIQVLFVGAVGFVIVYHTCK
jgi:hypothetical protein